MSFFASNTEMVYQSISSLTWLKKIAAFKQIASHDLGLIHRMFKV